MFTDFKISKRDVYGDWISQSNLVAGVFLSGTLTPYLSDDKRILLDTCSFT